MVVKRPFRPRTDTDAQPAAVYNIVKGRPPLPSGSTTLLSLTSTAAERR